MNYETQTQANVAAVHTSKDLVTSILIVSVLINLAVLVTYLWVSIDPSVAVAVSFK